MLLHLKQQKINPIDRAFSGIIATENFITVEADDYRVSLIHFMKTKNKIRYTVTYMFSDRRKFM